MTAQFSPLQSICYERGSLCLLDQRKLPMETAYVDILNAADGWNAIRDMVVRGAPAIAISAVLSLAVEVYNLDFSGTCSEAASFLINKLQYLVSSRPTAVNLSDAATKLQNVVLRTAEASAEVKSVFQTYIDAAEHMLTDDVSTNKSIGFHGAIAIQSMLNNSKRISILTHCNTGSLATAGYGTALGVIRALHANETLEMAFCTETRPFNQGSRLTAFELVHDKIPATLIADSAAASLMNAGRISAVIVGADRIAANGNVTKTNQIEFGIVRFKGWYALKSCLLPGDTANKIGTYSLAVCASHHGVPFFVAAPISSIDLSIPSGDQIVIEERSSKELLCSDGGLGKQVAASGINVWNPAFDVTPAKLITAIITEKGVIRKGFAGEFCIEGIIEDKANGKKSS